MRLGKPIDHLQAALRATFSSGPIPETITTIARQVGYFGYLSTDAVIWVWSFICHSRTISLIISLGPFRKIHNFESRKGEETHEDFPPLLVSWDTFQSCSWRAEGKRHLHLSFKNHSSCLDCTTGQGGKEVAED